MFADVVSERQRPERCVLRRSRPRVARDSCCYATEQRSARINRGAAGVNQAIETERRRRHCPPGDRWRGELREDALRGRRRERQQLRRRHEETRIDAAARLQPFRRSEEEGFVLDYRPAGGEAELVAVEELFRKAVRVAARIVGRERPGAVALIGADVKAGGAALR